MKNPHGRPVDDRSAAGLRVTDTTSVTSAIVGERLHHLRLKLLEEVHQLFLSTDRDGFLSEAASVLDLLHAMATEQGISWDEIERVWTSGHGSFTDGVFLHAVYGKTTAQDHEPATPCLLINGQSPSFLDIFRRELRASRTCRVATAFCTRAMLNVLLRPFEDFLACGGELSLLTSVMNNFNNPDDLLHLRHELPACRLRIYYPGQGDGPQRFTTVPAPFHLKCFLFEKNDGHNALIVGSSNLTVGGLERNEEWNLYSNSEVNLPFRLDDNRSIFETARQQFLHYWETDSVEVTEDFLEAYRPRWQRARFVADKLREAIPSVPAPAPRPRVAQAEALAALDVRRRLGVRRCAVIAATGLGKTHLAAFDFKQSTARNVLFVAHRENILREAREVFRSVLGDPEFGVVLSGTASTEERRAASCEQASVFAMVQTLSRRDFLKQLSPHQFDYIVVDEFHHSEAKTYRRVLDHFEPRFLLGLTATPERMDGRDVLRLCDYNVAYEARLFDAINQGWLVPFQYFAIHDESDYSALHWTGMGYDEEELERHLSTDTRAELIVNNLRRFLPATGKIKALAFCANRGHARYMTREFTRRGFNAKCLLGDSSEAARAAAIEKLQDEDDPLQVICSVDIFGEGVDIPAVSHVLLLRPTLSFTVFLQQLGRGLRCAPGKDFLVALDFVGNSRNSYVVPLIFRGCTSLKDSRKNGGNAKLRLPSCCTVDVDTQVQRIWDDDIRRTFAPRNRHQLLQQTYQQMRDDLRRAPTLLDFFANPKACDPQAFVKHYGNWLRTKEEAGDLTDYERQLLGTPGEAFLQHVEKELNSVRSYKMVVLLALLDGDPAATHWQVDWIARAFRQHYLDNLEQLSDCSPLAGAADPRSVPLGKITSLLNSMPLKYLSNKKSDYFTFDRSAGSFALNREVASYWRDPRFRELLRERVLYSLIRYFHAKGVDLSSYAFDVESHASSEEDVPAVPTTSLPFFSTLRLAAGYFRGPAGEPDVGTIEVPDPRERLRSDRHFVVQVEGNSMERGRTGVHDGDYVVLERLTPSRAGSLTGERAIAVEYRDEFGETAYALKQIRRDEHGVYWLHSWNHKYADIRVDPETMFPFARLIEVLGDLSGDNA